MTYYVADDSTITFPVTDSATPPGTLDFTPVVTAYKTNGDRTVVSGPSWLGSPGSTRDLQVPLGSIPAGLWSLRLTIESGADLFLDNVVIEESAGAAVPALVSPEHDHGIDDVTGLQAALDAAGGGLPIGTRTEAYETGPAMILAYVAPVDDPDLYRILYVPPGGIAEALAEIDQATFIINERGLLRVQQSPDAPTDVPFKIFGRGDTGVFGSPPFQIIPDRQNPSVVIFELDADGRIDMSKYPYTAVDPTGSTGGKYAVPSGSTYWPAGVRRIGSDKAEMRGSLDVPGNAITTGDVMGSVPAEFTPTRRTRLLASAGDGAQTVRVDAMTDGTLVARTTRATGAGYVSFDGVTYTL